MNSLLYNYCLKKNLFITSQPGGSTKDTLKITNDIVIDEFININKKS